MEQLVPAADVEVNRQAEEFKKATGIDITVEMINQNDMAARITAAVEKRSGPDVIQMNANQPHLFAGGLADHNALVAELLGDQAYQWASGAATVDGVARGVPLFNIGNAIVYRKDVFEELGLKVPNTWDEYLEVGGAPEEQQPAGRPDARPHLRRCACVLLSAAVELRWPGGRRNRQDRGDRFEGTHAALAFMKEFWEAACDPGGFAWDDTSNNRAFLGQTIGATLNGASIYFVARREADKYPGFADKLDHFLNPEGPAGRITSSRRGRSASWSTRRTRRRPPNTSLDVRDDNFDKFMWINNGYVQGVTPKWENHPVWKSDPAVAIFAQSALWSQRRVPALEPAVGRSAGEVHHRGHVRARGARRGSQGDRGLGAEGA